MRQLKRNNEEATTCFKLTTETKREPPFNNATSMYKIVNETKINADDVFKYTENV